MCFSLGKDALKTGFPAAQWADAPRAHRFLLCGSLSNLRGEDNPTTRRDGNSASRPQHTYRLHDSYTPIIPIAARRYEVDYTATMSLLPASLPAQGNAYILYLQRAMLPITGDDRNEDTASSLENYVYPPRVRYHSPLTGL